jgi:hypothetical protein
MSTDNNLDDLLGGSNLDDLLGGSVDVGLDVDTDDLLGEAPEAVEDPLAKVEYSGDLAQDAAAELTALEQGYRDRAKQESNRFRDATDSEYWFAVCFKTRAEKEAFLAKYKLDQLGDKYLDGKKVGKILDRR